MKIDYEELRDRKKLSTDGILFVSAVVDLYTGELLTPVDIQTKGFVFVENANDIHQFISDACEKVFVKSSKSASQRQDTLALRQKIKDAVQKVVFDKTRRSPIVLVSVFAV